MKEGYYVEFDGEYWRSVFPAAESEKAQLHNSRDDALMYMMYEHDINRLDITVIPARN